LQGVTGFRSARKRRADFEVGTVTLLALPHLFAFQFDAGRQH
jgi:hypothetical protein